MGYIYNKRKGYFTREDIVEAEKKDALKSIAIVLLAMLLLFKRFYVRVGFPPVPYLKKEISAKIQI